VGEKYKPKEKYIEVPSRYKPGRKLLLKIKDDDEKNGPVRDHCHITDKYRGSAHNFCNLKLRIDPENIKIPVIVHNLKGYDSRFFDAKDWETV